MELMRSVREARKARDRAGFSLIEALLASAIFLMVVVGILPLFIRATVSNVAGRESTDVSNQARSRAEELFQLPFNSLALTIQAGSQNQVIDYLADDSPVWQPAPSTTARNLYARTTTIRQYSVTALDDGTLDVTEALPAGSPPNDIHLKEIEVQLQNARSADVFGPQKTITIRLLKSK